MGRKLYRAQVGRLSQEIIATLTKTGDLDIEADSIPEAEKDIAAVLDEWLRNDSRILNRAKDILSVRRQSRESLGRIRRELAVAQNHQMGEDGLRWVQHQIIESMLASRHIEELYADDATLLRIIREVFDSVLVSEESLEDEVRSRLKNLDEGTPAWELQYQKTMQEVRRKHGLARPLSSNRR